MSLTDDKDYGLCPAPTDAQVALNELCRYLLGDDWYTAMPLSQEQVNTDIVATIKLNYKGYRKPFIKKLKCEHKYTEHDILYYYDCSGFRVKKVVYICGKCGKRKTKKHLCGKQ